jgi:preprotein translocase subunit Sec63
MLLNIFVRLWFLSVCVLAQRRALQDALRSKSALVQSPQELLDAVASGVPHIVIVKHINLTGEQQIISASSDAPILDIQSETKSIQVCVSTKLTNPSKATSEVYSSYFLHLEAILHLPMIHLSMH